LSAPSGTTLTDALDATGAQDGPDLVDEPGRWELIRALGVATVVAPPTGSALLDALGLPTWSRPEHTRLFVLQAPPYASIHLGAEGKLGGDGAERIAGVWRALGLVPPADSDHLAAIFALYAHLGHGAQLCRTAAARRRLDHIRGVVLWEHLCSWLPGYLAALADDPAAAAWVALTGKVLAEEARRSTAALLLPAALREAPEPIGIEIELHELLDALVAPLRVGFVLSHSDLAAAADRLRVGLRRGERRFALDAMLRQDPAATLDWLAGHARRWSRVHSGEAQYARDTNLWWAGRSARTATTLEELARRALQAGAARP
jgi:hypothetical protein